MAAEHPPIAVGTSIAPKDVAKQQAAVASWRALGFEVLSLNIPEEIASLRPQFPDVTFVPATRTAQERAGRPLVYFDDLLAALADTGRPIVGIVNSDILLRGTPGLSQRIAQESAGGFLCGHRVDIDAPDSTTGSLYQDGFDYFFFDRSVIALYPETDYAIGLPWWDYWAPAVPALNGVTLKRLVTPIAFHVRHNLNWDTGNWLYYAAIFGRYLSDGAEAAASRLAAQGAGDTDQRWVQFVAGLWRGLYRDHLARHQLAREKLAQAGAAERPAVEQEINAAEFLLAKHYGNMAEASCAFLRALATDIELTPVQSGST